MGGPASQPRPPAVARRREKHTSVPIGTRSKWRRLMSKGQMRSARSWMGVSQALVEAYRTAPLSTGVEPIHRLCSRRRSSDARWRLLPIAVPCPRAQAPIFKVRNNSTPPDAPAPEVPPGSEDKAGHGRAPHVVARYFSRLCSRRCRRLRRFSLIFLRLLLLLRPPLFASILASGDRGSL